MRVDNTGGLLAARQDGSPGDAAPARKPAPGTISFARQLQKTGAAETEAYCGYLKARYGSITVRDVLQDQKSIDALGVGTAGTGNVVIAPNILEQMANDPEKAAYYEGKIQHYFDSVLRCQAELSAMGHEIHSSGIVIHPDGTVTHYISGDLKPEVRARIEAQVKAEREEKLQRRQRFQELHAEAAEERRILTSQYSEKQQLEEALRHQMLAPDHIRIVDRSQNGAGAALEDAAAPLFYDLTRRL